MLTNPKIRNWATPLTIGSFAVTALTGLLLFFHLGGVPVKVAHEWLSLLFVLGGVAHMAANWRPCARFFTRPVGRIVVAACLLILLSAFLPASQSKRKPYIPQLMEQLTQAPVSAIAALTRSSSDELLARLRARGIRVRDEAQSLEAMAEENAMQSVDLLRIALERRARQ